MLYSQKVFGRTMNKNCLVSENSKNQLNCCEVRNVDSNKCSINEPGCSFSIATRL